MKQTIALISLAAATLLSSCAEPAPTTLIIDRRPIYRPSTSSSKPAYISGSSSSASGFDPVERPTTYSR